MKLILEPTSKVVTLNGIECRIWEGTDEQGVRLHCYIARVAILIDTPDALAADFADRLQQTRPPSEDVRANSAAHDPLNRPWSP